MSLLPPESPTQSFTPSTRGRLRAASGASGFRSAEVGQWLQDTYEHLDTQLDQLMTRNSQLSYNITTAQLLDMKHKVIKSTFKSPWKLYYLPSFAFASPLATGCFSDWGGFVVFLLSDRCLVCVSVAHSIFILMCVTAAVRNNVRS